MKISMRVGVVVCVIALVSAFSIMAIGIFKGPTQEKPPTKSSGGFFVQTPEQIECIAREIARILDYSPEETEAYVESVLILSKIPPSELILRLELDCPGEI